MPHPFPDPDAVIAALRAVPVPTPAAMFAADPDRLAHTVRAEAGLRYDWSRTPLSADGLARLLALAEARGLGAQRDALFTMPATDAAGTPSGAHPAERGQGAPAAVAAAQSLRRRMRGLVDAIEAEAIGPFRHILHIAAAGAASGPELLLDALGDATTRYEVVVVSGVDGGALARALRRCDPAATLVVIACPTFENGETLLAAASALAWLADNAVADPYGQLVAITAAPDRAVAWGVDETRVLPFADALDTRHALWSAVGFSAALALGWDAFESLLEGAAAMDRHFRLADAAHNLPLIAACVDHYQHAVQQSATRALFAYDRRLAMLPAYVAGLEMGAGGTGPVLWGGAGSDLRATALPRLHAATPPVAAEFVAVVEAGDTLDEAHHHGLLVACFAASAALMARDRPSTTILLDRLDPAHLGALLAFYEHRAFAGAVLRGDDSFARADPDTDTGVAQAIDDGAIDTLDPSTRAAIAHALA